MKQLFTVLISGIIIICSAHAQYDWKLQKDKDGIKVYTSESARSSFKSVKVECTLTGTFNTLIAVLNKVDKFEDWIYHNKQSKLIKRNSQHDFVYYSETSMPWPMYNRDVVLHVKINTDSLPKVLRIEGLNENGVVPVFQFRERVPHYSAKWRVTAPTPGKIQIVYILELDPGGSLPASIANMFAEKGPYETFRGLAKQLLK